MHRLIITFLLLAFHVIAYPAPLIASKNYIIKPDELAKLSAKATKEGHVLIIVGLKLSPPGFRPEGTLSPSEVEQQRNLIIVARETLLESMSGYDIKVYRSFSSIPDVAMKVDTDALEDLVRSPYVKSIEEDSLARPHGNDS